MKSLLAAFVITVSLWSMDSASFRYLGASRNKSHAAWMSFGVQDGSGFPWAVAEILATSPYRVLERHQVVITDGSADGDAAPDSAMVLASGSLARLGIRPEYGGHILIDHKLTDAGVPPDTVVFAMETYYTWYPGVTYTMVLEQTPSAAAEQEQDWFPSPVLPRLTITDGRSTALLFREGSAPEEHRLSFAYRIAKVIRLNSSTLLVVLNVMQPGFEGPDLRYRVVAVDFPMSWRH